MIPSPLTSVLPPGPMALDLPKNPYLSRMQKQQYAPVESSGPSTPPPAFPVPVVQMEGFHDVYGSGGDSSWEHNMQGRLDEAKEHAVVQKEEVAEVEGFVDDTDRKETVENAVAQMPEQATTKQTNDTDGKEDVVKKVAEKPEAMTAIIKKRNKKLKKKGKMTEETEVSKEAAGESSLPSVQQGRGTVRRGYRGKKWVKGKVVGAGNENGDGGESENTARKPSTRGGRKGRMMEA